MAVLGHVADGDPELLRRVDVDVVEPDAVAHDGAAGLETLEVGAVERDDRAGEDRDGVALDGEVEGLLRTSGRAPACRSRRGPRPRVRGARPRGRRRRRGR